MKKCRDREWKIEKKNGGKMRGGEWKIMTFIVATNIMASKPCANNVISRGYKRCSQSTAEHQPFGMPTARANLNAAIIIWQIFQPKKGSSIKTPGH